jgi:hypothetical protein
MDAIKAMADAEFHVQVGDVHTGIGNNSKEELLDTITLFEDFITPEIVKLNPARKPGKVVVSFLGDIHDSKQLIATTTMNVIIGLMDNLAEYADLFIFDGNHDLPTQNPNVNTNRYLERSNIHVISEPTLMTNFANELIALLPYMPDSVLKGVIDHARKLGVVRVYGHNDIAGFYYEGKLVEFKGNKCGISDFAQFKETIMGHIHGRQSIDNITFLGIPRHTRHTEYTFPTGIRVTDLKNDKSWFIENTVNSRYVKIPLMRIMEMTVREVEAEIKGNKFVLQVPATMAYLVNVNGLLGLLDGYKTADTELVATDGPVMLADRQVHSVESLDTNIERFIRETSVFGPGIALSDDEKDTVIEDLLNLKKEVESTMKNENK